MTLTLLMPVHPRPMADAASLCALQFDKKSILAHILNNRAMGMVEKAMYVMGTLGEHGTKRNKKDKDPEVFW